MKKQLIIAGLFFVGLVLNGCSITTKPDNTGKSLGLTIKENKFVVYTDSNCTLPMCDQKTVTEAINKYFGISGDKILFKDIKNDKETIKKLSDQKLNFLPLAVINQEIFSNIEKSLPEAANYLKQTSRLIDNVYYANLYYWEAGKENICNDSKDNNNDGKVDLDDDTCSDITLLFDSKCTEQECDLNSIVQYALPPLGAKITPADYRQESGKLIYDKLIQNLNKKISLPIILVNKFNNAEVLSGLKLSGKLIELSDAELGYRYIFDILPSKWDPTQEICDDGIDNNNDGIIDCKDSICTETLTCKKVAKPVVDVFVMSHCPYGTQMEKAVLPVYDTLKNKADINIKFVNYAMHGETEVNEEVNQYCINQQYGKDKYMKYLNCFLKEGKAEECKNELKFNNENISKCIEETNSKYNIPALLADKTQRFPAFPLFDAENKTYGIQGSPSLVINGFKIESAPRNPDGLLKLICSTFKKQPAECKKVLSTDMPSPGFGFNTNNEANATASCGN